MDGWADMVGFNIHYDVVAPLGKLQEPRLTYQNTILGHLLAIIEKNGKSFGKL